MSAALSALDSRSPVGILIANAGIGGIHALAPPAGEPLDLARRTADVNLFGVINTVASLTGSMTRRGKGQKRDRWRTARIPLLGIRKVHRGTPLAPAILALLVAQIIELGRSYDLEWVEFSWILETNRAMVALAELAAGPACKRYRMYSIPL